MSMSNSFVFDPERLIASVNTMLDAEDLSGSPDPASPRRYFATWQALDGAYICARLSGLDAAVRTERRLPTETDSRLEHLAQASRNAIAATITDCCDPDGLLMVGLGSTSIVTGTITGAVATSSHFAARSRQGLTYWREADQSGTWSQFPLAGAADDPNRLLTYLVWVALERVIGTRPPSLADLGDSDAPAPTEPRTGFVLPPLEAFA